MKASEKLTFIYSFAVHEGKETDFVLCWTKLTKLIYEFEGSYGSRLHKVNDQLFIGYAQWPDRETYDQSGSRLPVLADTFRKQMRECCSEIKTLFELSVVEDLLKEERHSNFG